MAINNDIPILRKCWVQPIIQYDLHISILPDVGGRILPQENSWFRDDVHLWWNMHDRILGEMSIVMSFNNNIWQLFIINSIINSNILLIIKLDYISILNNYKLDEMCWEHFVVIPQLFVDFRILCQFAVPGACIHNNVGVRVVTAKSFCQDELLRTFKLPSRSNLKTCKFPYATRTLSSFY